MADFGDNFEVDPAAEFLAREQDQLAGLEDELKPAIPQMTNGDGTGSFEMINTIGQGDSPFHSSSAANELADVGISPASSAFQPESTLDFFSSPGEFDSDAVEDQFQLPSHFDDSAADKQPTSPEPSEDTNQSTVTKPVIREEPQKIKKWREEQKKRLEEKDSQEEKTKTEMRDKAKKELEEWYKQHNELIAKTKADNRNAEKQFVAETDAIEPGTEWERISKLCDFNPKSSRSCKDTSRMRSIILQLKQSPVPIKH